MPARSRGLRLVPTLVASAVVASGCASTQAMARPAAFPTAALPPASIRPSVPAVARAGTLPDVLQTAFNLQGINYQLGGEFPGVGFDCSGFVRYVFTRNHVDVPRTVAEQFAVGSNVKLKDVREGDLVFFSTIAPGATHVGLVLDRDTFIHAPGAGGVVRTERLTSPYWQERIVGVKRILNSPSFPG
jgi:cell wall-associated NlpC family hydrolase